MTTSNSNVNSKVYERINAIPMSSGERRRAVTAMQDGELIAELILSIAHAVRLFFTTPGLKPSLKH